MNEISVEMLGLLKELVSLSTSSDFDLMDLSDLAIRADVLVQKVENVQREVSPNTL